tara:strand:+ start:190 stop:432 length:243 start_codon:yes stop_codon:yes gene_type:complete
MTIEILIFLLLLVIIIIVFIIDVLPIDVIVLDFLVVLLATRYLNIEQAIFGFSNKAVIAIAVMSVKSVAIILTPITIVAA